MSYELTDFEQTLKNKYSSEITVSHYSPIQRIVDYYSFSLEEIFKFVRGAIMFGPKHGFMKNDLAFDGNIMTIQVFLEDGYKHFNYFYCTNKSGVRHVMLFRSQWTDDYLKAIRRLENLRVFL